MKNILLILSLFLLSCNTGKNVDDNSADKNNDIIPASIVSIYRVENLLMPDASMIDVDSQNIIMEVQSQGQIMGNTGCNNYRGNYKYENGVLSTEGIASTRKACIRGMDLEKAFLNYMNEDLAVRLNEEERRLELSHNDTLVMKLKKIDE